MKKLLFFSVFLVACQKVFAQSSYWQQQVNFTIKVSLNDKDHTLDAFETIEYINNSSDTLHFIWFHIYPNAYKNDRTALTEQSLRERRTDIYFAKPSEKGYINQLDFIADGRNATVINDSNNIDIIKVVLPTPLPPGGKTILSTPFKVKLPYNFSRGGHVGNDYQVTQWFPKPAVYDSKGWHHMPYLDQGEFYGEFGNFDVEITTPSAYVVAATGILQDSATLKQLKEKGKHEIKGVTKTWHYKQDKVHDFAWFASKDFIVKYDSVILPSSKKVDVFSYYKPNSKTWINSIEFAKDGLKKYSRWIGDYPYNIASIVQGSENVNSGGMEYPTITLITTQQGGQELDATIVHEVGHNWFYSALASNERTHAWMDEGMNTFYQKRYEKEKYLLKTETNQITVFQRKLPGDEEVLLFNTIAKLNKDQPIETSSEDLKSINYGLVVYVKTSLWLKKLEEFLGRNLFDSAMRSYYTQWQHKHPYPQDFKFSMEKSTGKNLDSIFNLLYTTGSFLPQQKKRLKPTLLFNLHETEKYNYINLAPAVSYNYYDKGMIGAMVHNYQLPLNNLQFFAGAMYATGSKKWNAFGRTSYNIYKKSYNFSTALSYITYSQNQFITTDNAKLISRIQRWVPSIKLTLFDRDPLSPQKVTLQWKTFLLNEGALQFTTETTPTDTFDLVSVVNKPFYINRFSAGISDNRVLFPYSINFSADQGKDFVRAGITAQYYFNYADGKSGLSARFFAGKFFYLKPKTFVDEFNNSRYFLNLSAPSGYEDYTYSDYFIGRNEFEGWKIQQTMERDGFFKVNTNLLTNKTGKTDDWLMSLNLTSDLPDHLNPLSVLPVKIPFKLFADVGTYAEAWKNNLSTGRFLYDAGIQIPLFSSLVNVYVPIIYSKVYSNYYKSTITEKRFLKTISFTINIRKFQVQDIIKDIPL